MKKVIIMLLTLMIVSVGLLSGCNEQKATENPTDDTLDLVENKSPSASCSANPTTGYMPLNVSFQGSGYDTDGPIVDWHWDFDDGSNSTEQNPNHIYNEIGTYTVVLTVFDDDGAIDDDTIQILW